MYHTTIEDKIDESKVKILEIALREVIGALAEVHHQVRVIEDQSVIAQQEYKRALNAIEKSRNLLKMITL